MNSVRIKNIMSLGSMCEGFLFNDFFIKRIKGPVDNIEGHNFSSLIELFNGQLFDNILNDRIDKIENNPYPLSSNDDNYMRYYGKWMTNHYNLTLKHRKKEFKKRIDIFNKYLIKAQKDNSLYFTYTTNYWDYLLSKNDISNISKSIPKYVIDKLIIINGLRNGIPNTFYERFRCITYNCDLRGKSIPETNLYVNELWGIDI